MLYWIFSVLQSDFFYFFCLVFSPFLRCSSHWSNPFSFQQSDDPVPIAFYTEDGTEIVDTIEKSVKIDVEKVRGLFSIRVLNNSEKVRDIFRPRMLSILRITTLTLFDEWTIHSPSYHEKIGLGRNHTSYRLCEIRIFLVLLESWFRKGGVFF